MIFLFYDANFPRLLQLVSTSSYDLVILAAGMGSRFGGLKQVQPIGPAGELIIEYSLYDAQRAGFNRLVLVIRRGMEADFRAQIGRRLEARMDVQYVFQELDTQFPRGAVLPERTKPWGTGQAVLAAREVVQRPFAVINADDFYGAAGYTVLARHFAALTTPTQPHYALVGYPLKQTLSEFGAVSRGLCTTDARGQLQRITEITQITQTGPGAHYPGLKGQLEPLTGEEIVSMNFWGFTPAIFPQLEKLFGEFIVTQANNPKAEFYLPTALSALNESGAAQVALLASRDAWFGLTYREDLVAAQSAIRALIATGQYPAPLWG